MQNKVPFLLLLLIGFSLNLIYPQSKIYISYSNSSAIVKANQNGTSAGVFALSANYYGIAIDASASKIYSSTNNLGVYKAGLDGSGSQFFTGSGLLSTYGIALDVANNYIYACGPNFVTRAHLDGTSPWGFGALGLQCNIPASLALDLTNNGLYILNSGNGTVLRSDLEGNNIVSYNLSAHVTAPEGMALDVANNKMYITGVSTHNIIITDLAGNFISDLGNLGGLLSLPTGIALDLTAGKLYVVDADDGKLVKANLNGSSPENLGIPGTVLSCYTPFAIAFDGSAALPVELTSFTVKNIGNGALLNWSTATEQNNLGFAIERSLDNNNYQQIGFVTGAGNSNSSMKYSFTDNNSTGSVRYYYRLKQVDSDGHNKYSKVVELNVTPAEYSLGQNYPNPFNPSTLISYTLPFESHVKIEVYNQIGQKVNQLVNQTEQPGKHQISLNARSLSSGVYYYTITTNSSDGKSTFTSTKKMLLIK
jgi:hypothetical protein